MQVSLQSTVYLSVCTAINGYAAFSNPVRWITAFVLGVLVGTLHGRSHLRAAREGYQPGNTQGQGWDAIEDRTIREIAVASLASSMPGLVLTAIHLLALGFISKKIQLPSGWDPLIGVCFCDFASFYYGLRVGQLFQLDILQRDTNPDIKRLLAQTTI